MLDGEVLEVQSLRVEQQAPGSRYVRDGQVPLELIGPLRYEAVELLVRGEPNSKLEVTLTDPPAGVVPLPITVPLSKLTVGQSANLDDDGNRVVIRRAPGDTLRVDPRRPSLVFSGGEVWEPNIEAVLFDWPDAREIKLKLSLISSAGGSSVWSEERSWNARRDLSQPAGQSFSIPMPVREGAYDLQVELRHEASLRSPFKTAVLAQRKVQLVVVSETEPVATSDSDWHEVAEFDPAHSRWWDRLPKFPAPTLIGVNAPRSLDNGLTSIYRHKDRTISRIEPGGWQAYQLPIEELGYPHVLDVEYPNDVEQSLSISVVQPGEDGKVVSNGIDAGFHNGSDPVVTPGMQRFRMLFWPKSKTPYVMLHNRDETAPAAFGRIRVIAGPQRLPSAFRGDVDESEPMKMPMARFDQPNLPELFAAPQGLDAETNRVYDDWQTFSVATTRLSEYLSHAGYRGTALTVYGAGSTLYPSALLEPTPRFDTGAYFNTGQDVVRKDVVELMLRIFSRKKKTLLPAMHFSSPLPKLEQLLREEPDRAEGILLVDVSGRGVSERSDGELSMVGRLGRRYNPLDERVQQAIIEVVDEFSRRYAHHDALAGMLIELDPESHLVFPGVTWGADAKTLARFRSSHKLEGDADVSDNAPDGSPLRPEEIRDWVIWRSGQMVQFWTRLRQVVSDDLGPRPLLVGTSGLVDTNGVARVLRPSLPRRGNTLDAIFESGVDLRQLTRIDGLIVGGGYRYAVLDGRERLAVQEQWNQSDDWREILNQQDDRAMVLEQFSYPTRLRDFDQVSPFGTNNTSLFLSPRLIAAGAGNRRRWTRLLANDLVDWVLDGGEAVGWGQEETTWSIAAAYARLPRGKFATYKPSEGPAQPLIVKYKSTPSGTYLVAVNDAPWPATADIVVSNGSGAKLLDLASQTPIETSETKGALLWHREFAPFDVAIVRLASQDAQIQSVQVQVPEQTSEMLQDRIAELRQKMSGLKTAPSIPGLLNPGFDLPPQDDGIPGWEAAKRDGFQVRLDTQEFHAGGSSLRIDCNGNVASLRSTAMAAPTTGRVSMNVWLKVSGKQPVPRVRLAIEAKLRGQPYYRFVTIGEPEGQQPRDQWSPFLLHYDFLPLEGLTDFRVGFDVLGEGTIWVDDVEVHDTFFTPNEQTELDRIVSLASFQLREGRLDECLHTLDGYWPRFLMTHLTDAPQDVARLSDGVPHPDEEELSPAPSPTPSTSSSASPPRPATVPTKKRPGMFERLRRLMPRFK
ncbi:MAG: hypothetical protein R3E01_07100 [Pirellulaceae bacterium]